MNRILQFIPPRCPCCVAKRQYETLKARCEAIEAEALGTIDFCIPSAKRFAGELDEFDEEESDVLTVQIFVRLEGDRVPIDSDLRVYAVCELRRIAHELTAAADAVEAVSP